jgi:hypothetical protein
MLLFHMFSIYLGAMDLASNLPFGTCLVALFALDILHSTLLHDLLLVDQMATLHTERVIRIIFVICLGILSSTTPRFQKNLFLYSNSSRH